MGKILIYRPSKEIDYIYFKISPLIPLTENNFILSFSNHEFASSVISLDHSKPESTVDEYAVEIKYRCNDIGGALIDYKLEV